MMLDTVTYIDCLKGMDRIPDKSIRLITDDMPFGTTKCGWDIPVPLARLWEHYERIIMDNGVILLNGSQPFTSMLVTSNLRLFRYNWVWRKTTATGHLNAKRMPLKNYEDICVFYKNQPIYNPQKTTGHPRKISSAHHKRNSKATDIYGKHGLSSYDSTERYPKMVIEFPLDKQKSAIHPTQKPVALQEYFIKTYTNEGDIVLDNFMGSCTTAIACINTNRKYIGHENNFENYTKGVNRITKHLHL